MNRATFPSHSGLMRACSAIGFERLAWALRRLHCPVSRDALVLEVGAGGNPYPRANVLVDAYEHTAQRHWSPLVADRPTVLAFGEDLPFASGSFDFVIASHVLEHSADPAGFLTELQRVAKAGYIEVPRAIMERLSPYLDHRSEIWCEDGALRIRKKPRWQPDSELWDVYQSSRDALDVGTLMRDRPFAWHVRHYWDGGIAFAVVNPEVDSSWTAEGSSMPSSEIPERRRGLHAFARRVFSQQSRNRTLDVTPLLRCSHCRNGAIANDGGLQCTACGTNYRRDGYITDMRAPVSA